MPRDDSDIDRPGSRSRRGQKWRDRRLEQEPHLQALKLASHGLVRGAAWGLGAQVDHGGGIPAIAANQSAGERGVTVTVEKGASGGGEPPRPDGGRPCETSTRHYLHPARGDGRFHASMRRNSARPGHPPAVQHRGWRPRSRGSGATRPPEPAWPRAVRRETRRPRRTPRARGKPGHSRRWPHQAGTQRVVVAESVSASTAIKSTSVNPPGPINLTGTHRPPRRR